MSTPDPFERLLHGDDPVQDLLGDDYSDDPVTGLLGDEEPDPVLALLEEDDYGLKAPVEEPVRREGVSMDQAMENAGERVEQPTFDEEDSWGDVLIKSGKRIPEMWKQAVAGVMTSQADRQKKTGYALLDAAQEENSILRTGKMLSAIVGDAVSGGLTQDIMRGFMSGDVKGELAKAEEGNKKLREVGATIYDMARYELEENPDLQIRLEPGSLKNYANMVVEGGAGSMAPTFAAMVLTKNPTAAASLIGGQVFGQKYMESLEDGRNPAQASGDAFVHALAEFVPEIGVLKIIGAPGKPLVKKVFGGTLSEAGQEMITQAIQMGYDYGILDKYQEMTWQEALGQIRDAGIVGGIMGGSMAVALHPTTKGVEDDIRDRDRGDGGVSEPPKTEQPQDIGDDAAVEALYGDLGAEVPAPEVDGVAAEAESGVSVEPEAATVELVDVPRETKYDAGTDDRWMQPGLMGEVQDLADSYSPPSPKKAIEPQRDDVLMAIRKSGGLSKDEAIAQGIDPSEIAEQNRKYPGKPLFPKNGKSFDGMAENLSQFGYGDAVYSANNMLEMVSDTLAGMPARSNAFEPTGYEDLDIRIDNKPVRQEEIQSALAKHQGGDKLNKRDQLILKSVMDEAQERVDRPWEEPLMTAEEFKGEEDISPWTRIASLADQAMDVDQDAAERAMDVSEDVPFQDTENALLEIIKGGAREKAVQVQEAAEDQAVGETEAFGLETQADPEAKRGVVLEEEPELIPKTAAEKQAQAIQDIKGGVKEDVPVGMGAGDLFSGKAKQVDIEDVRDEEAIEGRPNETRVIKAAKKLRGKMDNKELDDALADADHWNDSDVDEIADYLEQEIIDRAAHEAATSPQNDLSAPTEGQKEAGNYKKGHLTIAGMDIAIENPEESIRHGNKMTYHYGYFKGTMGFDGDEVDVFVSDDVGENPKGFIIDQYHEDGNFDEHKVMLGFDSVEAAEKAYLENYDKGWDRYGAITEMDAEKLRAWVNSNGPVGGALEKLTPSQKPEKQKVAAVDMDRIAPRSNQKGAAPKNIAKLLYDLHIDEEVRGKGEEYHVVIKNDPFMDLVIESHPGFENGAERRLYLTHYYEQAGDKIMDAEMVFDIMPSGQIVLVETATATATGFGELRGYDASFAKMFSNNLNQQGFGSGEIVRDESSPKIPVGEPKKSRLNELKRMDKKTLDKVASDLHIQTPGTIKKSELVLLVAEREMEAMQDRLVDPKSLDVFLVTEEISTKEGFTRYVVTGADTSIGDAEKINRISKHYGGTVYRAHDTYEGDKSQKGWGFDTSNQYANFVQYMTGKRPVDAETKLEEVQPPHETFEQKVKAATKENAIVTDEAYAEIQAKLKAKMNQMSSGIDPEMLVLGTQAAVYHIERGARTFAAFGKVMIGEFGDWVKPYLGMMYDGARRYPGHDPVDMTPPAEMDDAIAAFDRGEEYAPVDRGVVEQAKAEDELGADVLVDDSRPADRGLGVSGASDGTNGVRQQGYPRVPDDTPGLDGAGGNYDLFGDPITGAEVRPAGVGEQGRGRTPDVAGVRVEPGADQGIDGGIAPGAIGRGSDATNGDLDAGFDDTSAHRGIAISKRRKLQKQAEALPVKIGPNNNVVQTLPMLLPEQQEDVIKAEDRLFTKNETGIVFTNGTGTGKTYTGLGIAKRFDKQGKSNILILVPTDPKVKDWIEDGKDVRLKITQLKSTQDAGKGVVVTTYANFYQNEALWGREWDLIIPDESHYLNSNADGTTTNAEYQFKLLTAHPSYAKDRAKTLDPKWKKLHNQKKARIASLMRPFEIRAEEAAVDKFGEKGGMGRKAFVNGLLEADQKDVNEKVRGEFWPREDLLEQDHGDRWESEGKALIGKSKVVFLSATPFAYVKSINYAEGYLFSYGDKEAQHYNDTDAYTQFMVQHFGFRIRYNKLTTPESGVDVGLMERQFHHWMVDQGSLSGRQLDVPYDYSRDFDLIDDKMGAEIDRGMDIIRGWNDEAKAKGQKYASLASFADKIWDYHYVNSMTEAIKAKQYIPRVREALQAGFNVAVYHTYNEAVPAHPFQLHKRLDRIPQKFWPKIPKTSIIDEGFRDEVYEEAKQFAADYPELADMDLSGLKNPREAFRDAFDTKDVRFFNGKTANKAKHNAIAEFNDDNKDMKLLVVQVDAGREGISLHDTTGNNERILVTLGLPIKPVDVIQTEGRIFRTGQASNARFLYPVLHTNYERSIYGSKIQTRAKTPENLALGDKARDLETSFKEGYLNAHSIGITETTGVGGKAQDGSFDNTSEWDKSKTFYYGRQKKDSRTKAKEGKDYFATPEPIGLKMVEWADIRPGESALEPSAGHGAIARFFPGHSSNRMIEPSGPLASQLGMVAKGDIVSSEFEDHNIVNKYDAIVMNPPYGTASKTAVEHLAKAFRHLNDGGRVIAILPDGPSTDTRLAKLREEGAIYLKSEIYQVAEIKMSSETFKRAGTSVSTRIVIFDKTSDLAQAPINNKYEVRGNTIEEVFDNIEHMVMPARSNPSPEAIAKKALAKVGLKVAKSGHGSYYVSGETYENRFEIKRAGKQSGNNPRWAGDANGWEFPFDPSVSLAAEISGDDALLSRISEDADSRQAQVDLWSEFLAEEEMAGRSNPDTEAAANAVVESGLRVKPNGVRPAASVGLSRVDMTNAEAIGEAIRDWANNGFESESFKAWNQNNQLMKRGEPVVFYHGTANPSKFIFVKKDEDRGGSGSSALGQFLTTRPETAKNYGDHVYPTYVRMNTPYRMPHSEFKKWIGRSWLENKRYAEQLMDIGYDGIMVHVDIAGAHKETIAIAFESEQIKSIENNGTFSDQDNIYLSRTTTAPREVMSQVKVEQIANTIQKRWKGAAAIEVVASDQQLPKHLQNYLDSKNARGKADGMFDPKTGKVYVVADQITSRNHMMRVVLHEMVGHYGLRQVMGKDASPLLNQIYLANKVKIDEVVKNYGLDLTTAAGQKTAAEEWLAREAETNPQSTWVQRAISVLREWARKVFRGLSVTDAELRGLLGRMQRAVRDGTAREMYQSAHAYASLQKPWYRSKMMQVLEKKLPAKGKASVLSKQIIGLSKEFKAEELAWSGILPWLEDQGDNKLSKEQIIQRVQDTMPKIDETYPGEENGPGGIDVDFGNATAVSPNDDWIEQEEKYLAEESINREEVREQLERLTYDVTEENVDNSVRVRAQEQAYENYYENPLYTKSDRNSNHSITFLGESSEVALYDNEVYVGEYSDEYDSEKAIQKRIFDQQKAAGLLPGLEPQHEEYTLGGGRDYQELLLTFENEGFYPGPEAHWDVDNVLVHVRFKTREDMAGKKTLFIEEIQSDWHQEGREKGYQTPDLALTKEEAEFGSLVEKTWLPITEARMTDSEKSRMRELAKTVGESYRAKKKAYQSGILDAPFKRSEAWSTLAMKRMIRWAAANGYNQIAWTPGQVHADRYSLSRFISKASLHEEGGGKYQLYMENHKGDYLFRGEHGFGDYGQKSVTPDELAALVGKSMAAEMIAGADAAKGDWFDRSFKIGERVGGSGQVGFYDKILPRSMNKYLKHWGVKVGTTTIDTGEGTKDYEAVKADPGAYKIGPYYLRHRIHGVVMPNGEKAEVQALADQLNYKGEQEVWSFDVTDQMVDDAMQGQPLFSLKRDGDQEEGSPQVQQLQYKLLEKIGEGHYFDRAIRLPFKVIGSIDEQSGEWSPPKIAKDATQAVLDLLDREAAKIAEKAPWMAAFAEKAKAGLIDQYGLSDEYKVRKHAYKAEERNRLLEGSDTIRKLAEANLSTAELQTLQSILTGEEIDDGSWSELAAPIRKAIDDMGQEMVMLGLISAESYEKNKGKYLHRVYMKHEAEQDGMGRWASKIIASRRTKIIGNEMKGRGMNMRVTMDKLIQMMSPEEKAGYGTKLQKEKADKQFKGKEFIVLDRLSHTGEGTETLEGVREGGPKPKLVDRIYWPANKPLPAKYKTWENRGKWEVRDTKGGRLVLWRDYTKDERQKMGEIVDARYTIARTYQLLSHDIAVGRFYDDIAKNTEWTWVGEGEPLDYTEVRRSNLATYTDVDWVRVPTDQIPGTGKAKWGALSGKFVRAEIWRDLNDMDVMNHSGIWRKLMTQWKLNKTARNPVVHMNNVMSNFLLADMADVRWQDIGRAVYAMRHDTEDYRDAMKHGAFGGTFISQEIRKQVMDPILRELQKQDTKGKGFFESYIGVFGRPADWITALDKAGVEMYQMEDELFRMATYLRRKEQGADKAQAAAQALDQFLNYDISAPWVNAARRTVLPFISYTYRAVPVVAKSIAKRPWKLAKYAIIAHGLNALGYALAGGEEEEERRSMRESEQGDVWIPGVPKMVRMPWRDQHGNPMFLDIRRWIPAGDIFDVGMGSSAVPLPSPFQWGGPIMLGFEFYLNKTAFTGRELTDDLTDSPGDVARSLGDWAWKSWMPSAPWVPNSWYWEKIKLAGFQGGRDRMGRPLELKYAAASSFGLKLKSQDVRLGRSSIAYEIELTKRRLQKDRRQVILDYRKGKLNPVLWGSADDTKRKLLSDIDAKLLTLKREARKRLKGVDE